MLSEQERAKPDEKTGVFTGAFAINPVNERPIPIWIADYVLMSYGTGAVMAVPAHDSRDHEFARVFNLPIIQVVEAPAGVEVQRSRLRGQRRRSSIRASSTASTATPRARK